MVLVGPIMMRAMSHGFMPGASVNWTFYLSKM
jgi:hypothetical protein